LEQVELAGGRSALLDAAHNPAGAEALAAFLAQRGVRPPLVFAAMRDKDARGILTALLPYISSLVLTRATTARSADPQTLLDIALALAPDAHVYTADSVRSALSHAWKLSPDIVVAGSIFLLGDVLQELERTYSPRSSTASETASFPLPDRRSAARVRGPAVRSISDQRSRLRHQSGHAGSAG